MVSGIKTQRKEFERILRNYRIYLETYRMFNNGSVLGATRFPDFYEFRTYVLKYSDQRVFSLSIYR